MSYFSFSFNILNLVLRWNLTTFDIRLREGEKMTLLETRLGQTERRIEREMSHIHGKMDDVFRNLPDKA